MREEFLLQRFNEETSGKNHESGKRVLENDLVSHSSITVEDNTAFIDGTVISENLFNEYNCQIEIDTRSKSVIDTDCTCSDFDKKCISKKNYCCKHLIATFYKNLEELAKHPAFREEEKEVQVFKKSGSVLSILLGDEGQKEDIKIEVYINKNLWNGGISAEFRIGSRSMSSSKLYILKDIEQFLIAYYNSIPVKYGKNFTMSMKTHRFTTKDKKLIEFIELLKSMDGLITSTYKGRDRNIEGKLINIPKYLVREFFECVNKHRIYLNDGFFYKVAEGEILEELPPLEFDLRLMSSEYTLKSLSGMPETLGSKGNVFLYGSNIYLPPHELCYKLEPYIKVFNNSNVVSIPKDEEDQLLRELIPQLSLLSNKLNLCKKTRAKVVMEPVEFRFYFHREKDDITLTLKVKYGEYEFNIFESFKEKVIYIDTKKESSVIQYLRSLGFEEVNDKFYIVYGDDYKFDFFKNKIHKLQEIGEVYYSENFKGIKSIGSKGISGEVRAGKYNYFEMGFKISDVPYEETADILRAFRDNLKYYKLKSGEYIDFEEQELKVFLKLLESLAPDELEDNLINIPRNKGIYLDNYLSENNLRYIKGKKHLKEIRDKFKNIDSLNFEVPESLENTLRPYQKYGFNWFKTLEYLGFGGILGDEMGLGKTLQTISFIASREESKSLIVAPTSLIYNWMDEFKKFAPWVKVGVNNGTIEEREVLINNIDKYNVIITTYNLLKRDLEHYEKIEFDYCILDEAQNIKNPHSQNAIAVKKIKCKNRFALSGTPIENSLMELWSIFDFIMPGYLYDEKVFSVRYHKQLKEIPEIIEELNRLIKPFILRRKKKDVIKELPDKIENHLMVSLTEEQKKVYSVYSKHAVELIEKKVKDDEFKRDKIEILSYITKLRQLCLDPRIVSNDYIGGSGKIEALVEILHQSIEEGHKILVFSQFTSVLKNISDRLKAERMSFSYLDGSIKSQKRVQMVKDFNEGDNSVFLISLKAGGTGLNLTSADIVIHFDPWWNPAVEDQATDRAHRIGQENVVEVIKIIAKGTIEEKIIALQDEKKKLINSLMDDEILGDNGFSGLSDDDIISLFEIE